MSFLDRTIELTLPQLLLCTALIVVVAALLTLFGLRRVTPLANPEISRLPVVSEKYEKPLTREFDLIASVGGLPEGPGLLLHNIPPEMTVGERELVQVRIGKTYLNVLSRSLEGNGDPEIQKIKIQPTMGVNLTATEGYFDIQLKNPSEEKLRTPDTAAEWFYEIEPLESGNPSLYLTPYIVVDTPEGRRRYEPRILTRPVLVHSNPIGTLTLFFKTNWQWLVGTMITLGVGTAILNRIRKWKDGRKHSNSSNHRR